ncbi:hypothetical protein [Streptomyces sp. NPDC054783]
MAVDIRDLLASNPRAQLFSRLEDSWMWSPNPRFTFVSAMSRDPGRAFQINFIDSFDADLACAVIEFARDAALQEASLLGPLTVTEGFSFGGASFDAVATASPAVHGYYVGRNEVLNEHVVAVFPAFSCEISGTESLEEAIHRFKRMLHPTVMSRQPVPFLRMRYENAKTGAGSVGDLRGFTTWDVLLRELNLLAGSPESFVECENVHADVRLIRWSGNWNVTGGGVTQVLEQAQLKNWASSFLGCSLA